MCNTATLNTLNTCPKSQTRRK